MMNMELNRLIFVPFITAVLSPILHAQFKPPETEIKPPQLKLEVIPTKKFYLVGDTVFVKYKLTSLVDGTLCFPPPAIEAQQDVTGYLTTEYAPPVQTEDSEERERFIESFWERQLDEERLRADIADRWIKLGMAETYQPRQQSKKSEKITQLTKPGDWVLQATYHPPDLSTQKRSIVESLGCTAPLGEPIRSVPVTISVLDVPR